MTVLFTDEQVRWLRTFVLNVVPGDGIDGIDGPRGAEGPPGPDGPSGPTGPTGPTGPAGHRGTTGPTGRAGLDGADGVDGVDGRRGATGPTGPTGPKGTRGPGGSAGGAGAPGAAGSQGPPGLQGIMGIQGPAGAAGAAGPPGGALTIEWVYDDSSTNTNVDPGTGLIRFNDTDMDVATNASFSVTDTNGADWPIFTYMQLAGIVTARFASKVNPDRWFVVGEGGVSDGTTFGLIGGSNIGSSGHGAATFIDGEVIVAHFDLAYYGPAGNNGAAGATGATGPAGATGSTGPTGPTGTAGTSGLTWVLIP